MPRKKIKHKRATPTCIPQFLCFTEKRSFTDAGSADESGSEHYLRKSSVEKPKVPTLECKAVQHNGTVSKKESATLQHHDSKVPHGGKSCEQDVDKNKVKAFLSETIAKAVGSKKPSSLLTPTTKANSPFTSIKSNLMTNVTHGSELAATNFQKAQAPIEINKTVTNVQTKESGEVSISPKEVSTPVLIRSETNSTSAIQDPITPNPTPEPERKERGRRRHRFYQYTYRERSESSSCDDTMPNRTERGRTRERRPIPQRKLKKKQESKPQPSTAFSGSKPFVTKKDTRVLASASGSISDNSQKCSEKKTVISSFVPNAKKDALASSQEEKQVKGQGECQLVDGDVTKSKEGRNLSAKPKRRRGKYKYKHKNKSDI